MICEALLFQIYEKGPNGEKWKSKERRLYLPFFRFRYEESSGAFLNVDLRSRRFFSVPLFVEERLIGSVS